jgi:hypothetical protein
VPVITVEINYDPFKLKLISNSATNNEWLFNGSTVENETGPTYEPKANGIFQLKVDYEGCFTLSEPTDFLYTATNENLSNNIKAYPNPVSSFLTVETHVTVRSVKLLDQLGNVVYSASTALQPSYAIDTKRLPPAVYILQVETIHGKVTKKVIK